jgi:hypothetical protein
MKAKSRSRRYSDRFEKTLIVQITQISQIRNSNAGHQPDGWCYFCADDLSTALLPVSLSWYKSV